MAKEGCPKTDGQPTGPSGEPSDERLTDVRQTDR
jgi:hypothetical protein